MWRDLRGATCQGSPMKSSRSPMWASALIVPALCSCGPEGEQIITVEHTTNQACADASEQLADGLQTGDEIILTVECANTTGDLDPLLDMLEAMQVATDPDGTPLLDLWVSAINDQLANAEGGGISVAITPSQMEEAVSQLLGFVESGAPQVALELVAESIETRVVEAGTRWLAVMMDDLVKMSRAEESPSLSAWADGVQAILCQQDPDTGAECRSSLQRFLAGSAANKSVVEYDPASLANDDLQQTLAWLLYAGGDVRRATESAEGLAKGLALMTEPGEYIDGRVAPPALESLFTSLLPSLFGDDLSTPYVYEGYPSHNRSESALYGIMLALRSPAIQDGLENGTAETQALVHNYYEGVAGEFGYATPFRQQTCASPSQLPETHGVANTGVEQLLRLLSAANVSYDVTDSCKTLFAPLLILGSPYLDVSGSTSVSALILEFAALLPIELLKIGATVLNTEIVTNLVNTACEINIQYDDTEVLEAAIYFPVTPTYSLPLIKALNDAHQIEPLVNYLDDLWQTPALCELGPTLRLALSPDAPASDGEGGDLDDILPDPHAAPGTTYHDQVIQPLLETVMDLGAVAPVVLPPINRTLQNGQEELVDLLLDLGAMANNPDSSLGQLGLLQAEMSQLGGRVKTPDLGPTAEALGREDLVELLAMTLSDPGVINAITVGTDPADTSILESTARQIRAGTFDTFLRILESLLQDLDESLSADDAE